MFTFSKIQLAFGLIFFSGAIQFRCNGLEAGTIIPLYSYPRTDSGENTWQKLFDAQRSFPINTWAIVNVNSGPGNGAPDTTYQSAVTQLHSAGIKTLGYVSTNYTIRSKTTVKQEIDLWKSRYNPHGIFFDEMAYVDDNAKVQYYQEVQDYAKSKGFTFTVGNPGTATIAKYFNTVDNIVTYERDVGFPSQSLICSQDTNGKGREHISILPYNVPNLDTAAVEGMKSCTAYIYVTDDKGDNPWDSLPNYLTQLFQTLKG